jgi:hypothetical protein
MKTKSTHEQALELANLQREATKLGRDLAELLGRLGAMRKAAHEESTKRIDEIFDRGEAEVREAMKVVDAKQSIVDCGWYQLVSESAAKPKATAKPKPKAKTTKRHLKVA